jgi:hypothetical protein
MAGLAHRGSFACMASDGRTRIVDHFIRLRESHSGGSAARDGMSEIRCEGEILEHAAKGRYRMDSGVELRTDDPDAP